MLHKGLLVPCSICNIKMTIHGANLQLTIHANASGYIGKKTHDSPPSMYKLMLSTYIAAIALSTHLMRIYR